MPLPVVEFFNRYSKAYSNHDVGAIVDCFAIPSIVMTDSKKIIFIKEDMLQDKIDAVICRYEELGIRRAEAEIAQVLTLSATMRFCNVDWLFYSAEDELLFECEASYTLQVEDDVFKIVALVVNDEEDAYFQTVQHWGTPNK